VAAVEELTLTVDGAEEAVYSVSDLQGMMEAESDFEGTTYVGVPMPALLEAAGVDPAQVETVKAVAADGYSMSYQVEHFTREDVLVAYTAADGELAGEEGTFRMVLPGEEGKLNVRMLAELQVVTK
jgi:DMSO/TMAO reductase YedYZ molybdopterin-dependent catalytic subunit